MATANERFTAWLSPGERQAIRDKAREYGTSENYVVRMAIRQALQLGAPRNPARETADRAERV